MGGSFSKLFRKHRQEIRILMLGLDGAGKTTILYQLRLGNNITTIPTVGFNVESVKYKNVQFNVWDVGGQEKIRSLWRHYYTGTQGLIFVIDGEDRRRLSDAKMELHKVLADREMRQCVLLVFANKQDLNGAMSAEEVTHKLELSRLKNRPWYVVPSVAKDGEGLYEGLSWLQAHIPKE